MVAWVMHWGYLGLFAAIFIEEAGVPLPVPGDVFIAALGAAGRVGAASFPATTLVVLCASVSGSALLFWLSRRMGHPLLLKVGRRFGFDADRAEKTEMWLRRRGSVAVVIGRLTPGLRIVLTVAAGALRMNRPAFLIGTAVASVLWAAIYYWLGFALGAGVSTALKSALGRTLHNPDALAAAITALVLAILAAAGTVVWRRKRARRKRARVAPGVGTETT